MKKQNEENIKKAQEKEYERLKKEVALDPFEIEQIDREASRLAHDDLAKDKIRASELGAAIKRHSDELIESSKATKATNQLFNSIMRGGSDTIKGVDHDEAEENRDMNRVLRHA